MIDYSTLQAPLTVLKHSNGDLVVAAEDGRPTCFKPEALGCYVINVNRTDRGLAKERLRDYWENL